MKKYNFIRNFITFHKTKNLLFILSLFLFVSSTILASHNASRYFPFIERPAEYTLKRKSSVFPALFYSKASTASKRGGGTGGIPELYGNYDLRDIIFSLKQVNGAGYVDPITRERGAGDAWIDKSMRYKVNGKVKTLGLLLNYEQYVKVSGNFLRFEGLSFGISAPLMHVNTSDNFYFLTSESDTIFANLSDSEKDQLNRIRRLTHDDLGLQGGDWTKSGFGDVDLHMGLNYNWDHKWLMRSIDLNFRLGTTIPTGMDSDIDLSSAVSFMGDGHWSVYFDIVPELELKTDWKIGLMFGAIYQFDNTRHYRVPVYQEPSIFSALKLDLKTDKGMTFKIAPYFIAENLTDGIDLQVRYTYLRHSDDKYIDTRTGTFVKSYLNQDSGITTWGTETLTQENIDTNINSKINLSRWRMHYLTFELVYDSKEAGNNWILDPKFFMTYDYQFSGNGSCKTHQLTLGVQALF